MINNNDIEAIKQLKYRYFRLLDLKRFDELEQLMLPECTSDLRDGRHCHDNRDSLMAFLRESMGRHDLLSMHNGHHPEIEMIDDHEARGTWNMHDIVIDRQHDIRLEGNGFYEDRYRKVNGEWFIVHTGYKSTFELVQPLGKVLEFYNGFDAGTFGA